MRPRRIILDPMNRVASTVLLATLLAACTQSSTEPTTAGSTVDTTAATVTATTEAAIPTRMQMDWFVRVINGGPLSEEVYEERFADVFRLQVPYEAQFSPIVAQLEATPGDWILVSFIEQTPEAAVGIVAAGDERIQVSIPVNPDPPHKITGLFVSPSGLASTPDSFENAVTRLEDLGDLWMLAAQVGDGECIPIEAVREDEEMPLGSVFKLFVLETLTRAVEQGDVSWDDEVVIRDELKSIPSGILQDEPHGTVRSVREVAELMISISDNTATDHLIDLLGRQKVEATIRDLGLARPELNIPFLTTREFAALKVGPSAGLRAQYVAADEAGKRAILDQISDITAADIPVLDFVEPTDPDTLEWFATPVDMCRVLAGLWQRGDGPVRDILTKNPGVAPPPGIWERVAFKGGSEPGLLAVSWLVEAADGKVYVLTGSILDSGSLIDDTEGALLFAAARDLMATE